MSAPAVDPWVRAYVEATATALELPIAAEHRASIERQFARLAAFASVVAEHRFDIAEEPPPLHLREP